MVRKTSEGFVVYSESGKKLSRAYPTRQQAENRLREIEWFKSKKK